MSIYPDNLSIPHDEDSWCSNCQKTIEKRPTSSQAKKIKNKKEEGILFINIIVAQIILFAAVIVPELMQ